MSICSILKGNFVIGMCNPDYIGSQCLVIYNENFISYTSTLVKTFGRKRFFLRPKKCQIFGMKNPKIWIKFSIKNGVIYAKIFGAFYAGFLA